MKQDRVFHKHPVLSLTVFLVIMFLAIDIIGTNIFKIYSESLLKKNDHEKEYRIPSSYYHHDLKPNVNIPKTVWGCVFYPIVTNSLGFRDKLTRKVTLKSDRHRILFIGDSFTEGIGVAYENTFVGIIDSEFHKKNIEVLNAAVCSYSPSIYYAKVKYLIDVVGLHFNELVVFIDISDISNEAVDYHFEDEKVVDRNNEHKIDDALNQEYIAALKKERGGYLKVEKILKRDTLMTYLMVKNIHDLFFLRNYSYDYDSINIRAALWTVNRSFFDEFGKAGLDESAKNMDRLASFCRDKNIVLTIAVYPWTDQIIHHDLNSLQIQFWSNWAKKFGIKVINFFPYFISQDYSTQAVRDVLDSYFISGDVHWNNEGHRKIAEIFLHKFKTSNDELIKHPN